MQTKIQEKFRKMDSLSLSGEAFFFIVDFLVKDARIWRSEDIKNLGLFIDFQTFKTDYPPLATTNFEINLKINPPDFEIYKQGFEYIQKHLRLGNSYLANYTAATEIETPHSLQELFAIGSAKYKFCVPDEFIFFSPETFVQIHGNRICTQPMKGTIDADTPDAERILKNSIKEKAEHYTVVDLLRNDLSIVADEVCVDNFQRVDFLKTSRKNLLAMSSEISGNLKAEYRQKIGSIMEKMLPAGSILGAPKRKTLDIILEAEKHDRGWYTGICGYFDGENLDSCVMIRFIEKRGGKVFFKSGGGITHMSDLHAEYSELIHKIYVPLP